MYFKENEMRMANDMKKGAKIVFLLPKQNE